MFYWIENTDGMRLLVDEDGVPFPENHANTYYCDYLEWVAEGNEATEWTGN